MFNKICKTRKSFNSTIFYVVPSFDSNLTHNRNHHYYIFYKSRLIYIINYVSKKKQYCKFLSLKLPSFDKQINFLHFYVYTPNWTNILVNFIYYVENKCFCYWFYEKKTVKNKFWNQLTSLAINKYLKKH